MWADIPTGPCNHPWHRYTGRCRHVTRSQQSGLAETAPEEGEDGRGRDGKTTSNSGQAWTAATLKRVAGEQQSWTELVGGPRPMTHRIMGQIRLDQTCDWFHNWKGSVDALEQDWSMSTTISPEFFWWFIIEGLHYNTFKQYPWPNWFQIYSFRGKWLSQHHQGYHSSMCNYIKYCINEYTLNT